MILIQAGNDIFAEYHENDITLEKLIENYSSNEFRIHSVPDEYLGIIENLPNMNHLDDFPEIKAKVQQQTASLNRKMEEIEGIFVNGIKFKTDTKTCSSILGVISSIQGGFIGEPVFWRGESGTSGKLTLQELLNVAKIVLPKTQTQFTQELSSTGG